MKKTLKWLGIVLIAFVLALALLIAYWYLRPNRAQISDRLTWQTWDAVNDELHNSNTDMLFWRDQFYLVHASSPFHFASDTRRDYTWILGMISPSSIPITQVDLASLEAIANQAGAP